MSVRSIIDAILVGDNETAEAELSMELDARCQEIIANGTQFVMQSVEDDINGLGQDFDDDYDDYDY